MLKVIPFGDDDGPTIYKGEGTIQFTAYYPYAHTPDFVYKGDVNQGDGRLLSSYSGFNNIEQWQEWNEASQTYKVPESEMEVHFELATKVPENKTIEIGKLKIKVEEPIEDDIIWNSKTGAVFKYKENAKPVAIKFTGRSFGTVPSAALIGTNAKYRFWYY